MAKTAKRSTTSTSATQLSNEKIQQLMVLADITYKGKGDVPREKLSAIARKKSRSQKAEYTALRRRIKALRYVAKFAVSDELSEKDVKAVDSLLTGKEELSEEFEDFTI